MPSLPVTPGARRAVAGGLLVCAAAVVALVLALLSSGAAEPALLADPGALVRWGLPLVTVVTHLAATLTVGCFAVAAVVLVGPAKARTVRVSARERAARAAAAPGERTGSTPAPVRNDRRHAARPPTKAWTAVVRAGTAAAVVWGPAQVAHLLLTHASVVGEPLTGELYTASLRQFVTELDLGVTLVCASVLALLVGLVAVSTSGPAGAAWTAVLGVVALAPIGFTGHANGAANHEVAMTGMWLHLAGVVLWMGGLAGLLLAGRHLGSSDLSRAAPRYSSIAAWASILVVLSGVASALLRVNGLGELVTTGWGRLLLVKIIATGLLLAAGGWHRRSTLPALARGARGAFTRLALGEVVLMSAVVGVAVALGSSETPVPIAPPPDPTPTYVLTNSPVPPFPTPLAYLTVWRPDPLFVALVGAGVLVYGRWALRLRRRGIRWPVSRTICWYLGMAVFAYLTIGAPAVYGDVLFSVHMAMHMALTMLVPLFVVLAAPVTLALRALPVRQDGSRGPREWLLALVGSPWAKAWAHPIVAGANFAGSLVVFYFTPLFDLALGSHVGHILMVVHFSLAGYMFANALIGIDPGPTRPPYPLRLVLLIATMGFHAFFGVAVMQATSLLGAGHFGWLGLPWGVDAMADQEVGGAITWGVGEFPTLALAVGVAVQWARSEKKEARRVDRRADADGDAELAAYNEMLAARARGDRGR
ncbi:cytochrome c oxidase assembly protein [Georgenia sp. Z1491]|uniref:cytochrome c oxidase assembly protein n=1 Tax=Georgenia sp. Z1491 TaxID=3416707 RepID=UPI003CF3F34C